jgi:hypothetical protein
MRAAACACDRERVSELRGRDGGREGEREYTWTHDQQRSSSSPGAAWSPAAAATTAGAGTAAAQAASSVCELMVSLALGNKDAFPAFFSSASTVPFVCSCSHAALVSAVACFTYLLVTWFRTALVSAAAWSTPDADTADSLP